MKKEETNDIVQFLLPALEKLGIPKENIKVDVTSEKSGRKRGDVWISAVKQGDSDFEKNIIALIEAKHRNTTIGDIEWRNAMKQGREKGARQGLNYYVVTNCRSDFRYYNAHNDEEIFLDGKVLIKPISLDVLKKIQTQVNKDNWFVVHKTQMRFARVSEPKFRTTLKKLAHIYRSAGLEKDSRIDPTVSLVVLKYLSEKEKESRSLNKSIKLWDDFRSLANDLEVGDLRVEFEKMMYLIWDEESQYKENVYKDFKDLIAKFSTKLKNEDFKKLYRELDGYHFHGADFDLFGAIYEEFASKSKKKEFGEFYTRRHIASIVARLLLRNEITPREELNICDPACGTGGFLTEAFKTLRDQYSANKKLNENTEKKLKLDVLWGYDNDEKSVARTKLNMFLVGDGHIHIYDVDDSLIGWDINIGWKENEFDYVLTNPPMGQYKGKARIEDFAFTNEKRYELLFVEIAVKAVKPGGEVAIVVNDGALEAPSREKFRTELLKTCDINAIVSLTKFAFAPYTKEKTYVLFMQKKQLEEANQIQKHPIWHFIVDYDGYANSDKRFRTKYHDDLPELRKKFERAVKQNQFYITDRSAFEQQRANYEREVNPREKSEGLTGMKCGFVEMDRIREANFHNLLSEFHLRPVDVETISEDELDRRIRETTKELKALEVDLISELDKVIASGKLSLKEGDLVELGKCFNIKGGNSGLTEEFLYNNQPIEEEDMLPIYSGATLEENLMGYITREAKPAGKNLKIFKGPCILVSRKGYAGVMSYITEGEFTTNDDAYVLTLKSQWKNKINLRWFVYQFQSLFRSLVTSKSDNSTFNKKYAQKQSVLMPEKELQECVAEKLNKIDNLTAVLTSLKLELEKLLEKPIMTT